MGIDWTLIIVAVAGGIAGSIPGLVALRGQYKTQNADASSTNVDTALKLMKTLESQVEDMQNRINLLEHREDQYIRYLKRLIRQIESLGVDPVVTLGEINHINLETYHEKTIT